VFEAGSRLSKIESKAVRKTAITEIVIQKCVVLIGAMCFAAYQSLTAIAFEAELQLKRVESQAFAGTAIPSMVLPETIQSLLADAFEWTCTITIQKNWYDNERYGDETENASCCDQCLKSVGIAVMKRENSYGLLDPFFLRWLVVGKGIRIVGFRGA
jgi:hypothetical protein